MDSVLAVARAAHYAGAIMVFGELVFLLLVRPAGVRQSSGDVARSDDQRAAFLRRMNMLWASLAIAVTADCVWLGAEAGVMSGLPWQQAIRWDTLSAVLGQTTFGRIWVWRLLLTALLCTVLAAVMRMNAHGRLAMLPRGAALLLAGAVLATSAFAGHAGAGTGTASESEDRILLASDVVHLLAVGAWIGALPALISVLASTDSAVVAFNFTRRFSTLAVLSVVAIAVTGSINAWFLVGTVAGLVGTGYGQLLSAKLALFCFILGFAAVNRWFLTPALGERSAGAQQRLRRNATWELALALGIVAIVGILGVTIPAMHQSAQWPFAHRLSWQSAEHSQSVLISVCAAGGLAIASIALALVAIRRRRLVRAACGIAAALVSMIFVAAVIAVPAFPTSYVASPIAYDVPNVAAGAKVYAQHCDACHRGENLPAQTSRERLAMLPPDHGDVGELSFPGETFWRIAHGVPGAPGHAFSPALSDEQIWQVVEFLRTRAGARTALSMSGNVQQELRAPAPDFTFEVAGMGQSSLSSPRDNSVTLLVFYSLPQSLPRLRDLIAANHTLMHLGMQVIAIPSSPGSELTAGIIDETSAAAGATYVVLAKTGPDVPVVYAMFARRREDPPGGQILHAELLVDRNGDLRARWIGLPVPADRWDLDIAQQTTLLSRESASARASPHRQH